MRRVAGEDWAAEDGDGWVRDEVRRQTRTGGEEDVCQRMTGGGAQLLPCKSPGTPRKKSCRGNVRLN